MVLVATLKDLREKAGLDLQQAADAAGEGFSKSKISRIESLKVGISPKDTATLATIYGADPETVRRLVTLAREAKVRGWLHTYPAPAVGNVAGVVELQDAAVRSRQVATAIIPGLLQTREYAKDIISHG